jgi:hypothetical protein
MHLKFNLPKEILETKIQASLIHEMESDVSNNWNIQDLKINELKLRNDQLLCKLFFQIKLNQGLLKTELPVDLTFELKLLLLGDMLHLGLDKISKINFRGNNLLERGLTLTEPILRRILAKKMSVQIQRMKPVAWSSMLNDFISDRIAHKLYKETGITIHRAELFLHDIELEGKQIWIYLNSNIFISPGLPRILQLSMKLATVSEARNIHVKLDASSICALSQIGLEKIKSQLPFSVDIPEVKVNGKTLCIACHVERTISTSFWMQVKFLKNQEFIYVSKAQFFPYRDKSFKFKLLKPLISKVSSTFYKRLNAIPIKELEDLILSEIRGISETSGIEITNEKIAIQDIRMNTREWTIMMSVEMKLFKRMN